MELTLNMPKIKKINHITTGLGPGGPEFESRRPDLNPCRSTIYKGFLFFA